MKDYHLPPCHKVVVSPDGYIRLPLDVFSTLPLEHLSSALDCDPASGDYRHNATLTTISGYTEWISATRPTVSLGWDWQMGAHHGQLFCKPVDDIRSNLMLLDENGKDLGMDATNKQLNRWLSSFDWQPAVLKTLHPPRSHSG